MRSLLRPYHALLVVSFAACSAPPSAPAVSHDAPLDVADAAIEDVARCGARPCAVGEVCIVVCCTGRGQAPPCEEPRPGGACPDGATIGRCFQPDGPLASGCRRPCTPLAPSCIPAPREGQCRGQLGGCAACGLTGTRDPATGRIDCRCE